MFESDDEPFEPDFPPRAPDFQDWGNDAAAEAHMQAIATSRRAKELLPMLRSMPRREIEGQLEWQGEADEWAAPDVLCAELRRREWRAGSNQRVIE